jgi:hypothetical protein
MVNFEIFKDSSVVEKGEESKAFSNEQCFSMDVANNIIFE